MTCSIMLRQEKTSTKLLSSDVCVPAQAALLSRNRSKAKICFRSRLTYGNHPLHLVGIWMGSTNASNATKVCRSVHSKSAT
ncbi:unnamed protein product [Urochloa humidicola]